MNDPTTDHHKINELLFASEDVALFFHTLADCFGYEPDTLDQTELHGQVLKWGKIHKYMSAKYTQMHKIQQNKWEDIDRLKDLGQEEK